MTEGFEVLEAANVTEANDSLRQSQLKLVIVEASAPFPDEALFAAHAIRNLRPGLPVLLLVKTGSEALAVAAFRAGITDYFHAPLEMDLLVRAARNLTGTAASENGKGNPLSGTCARSATSRLIGNSPPMLALRVQMERIAPTNTNILVTGETGTGKELVAATIHQLSPRKNQAFTCLNCAAIPDSLLESELFGCERGAFTGAYAARCGLLETSVGGTIFLDEIADLSPYAQAKLLRVIENKEFRRLGGKTNLVADVRFVAATNRNIETLAEQGGFRQDLYFRLNVVRVHLPPLRDRPTDIPWLLQHFILELNAREGRSVTGLADEVWKCLLAHEWPGNVRELKNLMEAAYINSHGKEIRFSDLPEQFRERKIATGAGPGSERERLLSALLSTKWNKSKAAERLRWSRMKLYRRLAKYDLLVGGWHGSPGPGSHHHTQAENFRPQD